MKKIEFNFVHYGLVLTVVISALLAFNLFSGDQSLFLPNDTTHGHHQIELQCSSCHSDSFSDEEDMQQACMSCHGKELDAVNDSHPKKKFTDPRNAELRDIIDATYCVTCHVEHKPDMTHEFGVTVPKDFCFHCHQDIAEERESHKDLEFDTCATAGCHNFHDNSMLYEKFLTKHIDGDDLKKKHWLPKRTSFKRWLKKNKDIQPLTFNENDGYSIALVTGKEIDEWANSIHATAAVNCSNCHDEVIHETTREPVPITHSQVCSECHSKQVEQFGEGKHGMRLRVGLPGMDPSLAHATMHENTDNAIVGCHSCHNPHSLDVRQAAIESCLGCHNDEHSQNYKDSKHFTLYEQELAGEIEEGSGVTCATCHLPRIKKGKKVMVEHNQNRTLQPNTKMLRKVCMNCHGLQFSLTSLDDEKLIENNFQGLPDKTHQTFDLIQKRIENKKNKKKNKNKKKTKVTP